MFRRLTPMVKALLIINVVVFLLALLLIKTGFNLNGFLALYKFDSNHFALYQFFTYMFSHSLTGIGHILFNMIGLIVFGSFLENFWGSNKFLIFYLGTGIGAAFIYSGINYVDNANFNRKVEEYRINPDPNRFNIIIVNDAKGAHAQLYDFINRYSANPDNPSLIKESNIWLKRITVAKQKGSMVGASGAVYGLIMACAMLFPNLTIMLLIPPIPIKMKYLALLAGGYAIYNIFAQTEGDNVAHLAHLGGMIFAYIMIMFWRKKGTDYS